MDRILEMAKTLTEGVVPIQLVRDSKGYYFDVFKTKYGYFNSEEVVSKLSDLGATFKNDSNYKQMKAIASKNGNVWIRVDSDKLSSKKDAKGVLAGNKLAEGIFLADDYYKGFFEGVEDAVSCEKGNLVVTVGEVLGGSIVSITDVVSESVHEIEYYDHDTAISEAYGFITSNSSLTESLDSVDINKVFSEGHVLARVRYSSQGMKRRGRPIGRKDSKPRTRRTKIKRANEVFSDLVQLKGNEYEANNQGSEDRYLRVNRILGVKPVASKRSDESTEASAIKGKVAGGTNNIKKVVKKRNFE